MHQSSKTSFSYICMLPRSNPSINVYDITKTCDGRLCYDFSDADEFLNTPSIRKALGVGDRQWEGCSYDV